MRVSARNGITSASGPRPSAEGAPSCSASARMLFPSGVSSPRLDCRAAMIASSGVVPDTGMISAASRLPKVIVPVLSSSRVSTSPAASTARPDMASTLKRVTRSMPAIPMAESRPPMVVGIRQTSKAINTTVETGPPA